MKKIKTGIIGAGKLGSFHAKVYSKIPQIKLAGIYDIDQNRSKKIANTYKTKFYSSLNKLLENVEAVSITAPTNKHFEIAEKCLEKHIHMLIEKPVTSTITEANKLVSLAKKSSSIIQVGHIERFNSAIKAVLNLPDKPKFIECHRLGLYSPRGTDVSVTKDLMIHDIDIILALVNSKIKKIDAVGVEVLSNKNDIVNARITFQNQTVANLTSSRVSRETVRKIRMFQKETYISLDYIKQKASLYRKKDGKITKTEIKVEKEEPLKAELSSFAKCIINNTKPLVSITEAVKALEIAVKIDKITEQKKEKIK